jgi:predicted transcriptional regulator
MRQQITVRLTDDLARALDKRARQTGEKPSEIVRSALREHLQLSGHRGQKPVDRVRRLIGSLESGHSDLAENHRTYVLESLKT